MDPPFSLFWRALSVFSCDYEFDLEIYECFASFLKPPKRWRKNSKFIQRTLQTGKERIHRSIPHFSPEYDIYETCLTKQTRKFLLKIFAKHAHYTHIYVAKDGTGEDKCMKAENIVPPRKTTSRKENCSVASMMTRHK